MTGDEALLALLRALAGTGYRFVTTTPATHARVLKRLDRRRARTLRDIFGWSLPFDPDLPPPPILSLLERAGALLETDEGLKSAVRVSNLGDGLFLHSAYPTDNEDAVFFGPDSYRFARLVEEAAPVAAPQGAIVDIGAGTGVGGLAAARRLPGRRIVLTDVNPKALRLARVNAAFAGVAVETVESGSLDAVEGPIALALANPPYIDDGSAREYRDGGAMHGGALSVEMARAAAARLEPGGRLILYTGAAIVDGTDALHEALERVMIEAGCRLAYRELDPDVFGEELDRPAYRDVERIAVVAALATKD
jgi:precorrin-6B methylase 2